MRCDAYHPTPGRAGPRGGARPRFGAWNRTKIDDAMLALLYLTLHDGVTAWKGHDWDALDLITRDKD